MYPNPYTGMSDEDLCQLYKETRQQEIIVELLDRYDRYLISLTIPFLQFVDSVGDFKIDLFILLHKLLKTSEPKVFKHWLGTVARRKIYDRVRKSRPEIWNELPDKAIKISNNWDSSMDFEELRKAIESLKPDQRVYIELAFLMDYKPREITIKLGWPIGKARIVRQNAIRNLRKRLGGPGSEFEKYLDNS